MAGPPGRRCPLSQCRTATCDTPSRSAKSRSDRPSDRRIAAIWFGVIVSLGCVAIVARLPFEWKKWREVDTRRTQWHASGLTAPSLPPRKTLSYLSATRPVPPRAVGG